MKDKILWFIDVEMETYRKPPAVNPFEEEDDDDTDYEIRICDGIISVHDIQMVTDVSRENRIAVMLTDSSIVSVVSTLEEFKVKLGEYRCEE